MLGQQGPFRKVPCTVPVFPETAVRVPVGQGMRHLPDDFEPLRCTPYKPCASALAPLALQQLPGLRPALLRQFPKTPCSVHSYVQRCLAPEDAR